jgi:hypothetical protein
MSRSQPATNMHTHTHTLAHLDASRASLWLACFDPPLGFPFPCRISGMDASNGGISQTIYISNLNEKINKQGFAPQ